MTRPLAVLRPEPGNARTAAAIKVAGGTAIRLPLFTVGPVAWQPPDPAAFDAVVATSANIFRHGGTALAALQHWPVHAVGEATARAARAAGFPVASVGSGDVAALVADIPEGTRLLHLAGRERHEVGLPTVTVYAAEPRPIAPADIARLTGSVALLHSARAATRLAALVADRLAVTLALLSPAIAEAAGDGWRRVAAADRPTDAALVALAMQLAD